MKMLKTPSMRICKNCGKNFPFKWYKIYCSESCRQDKKRDANIAKIRYRLKHPILPVVCPVCKITFMANRSKKKYCSRKCMWNQLSHNRKIKTGYKEIGKIIGGKKIGS